MAWPIACAVGEILDFPGLFPSSPWDASTHRLGSEISKLHRSCYMHRLMKRPDFCARQPLYYCICIRVLFGGAGSSCSSTACVYQSDRTRDDAEVFALARDYVRVAAKKSGEAFVALVHRLDRLDVTPDVCPSSTQAALSTFCT